MKIFGTTLIAIEKKLVELKSCYSLFGALCINKSQNQSPSLLSILSFICFPIEWKVND